MTAKIKTIHCNEIKKGFYGWEATTVITLEDGKCYQAFTMKRHCKTLVTDIDLIKLDLSDNAMCCQKIKAVQTISSIPKRTTKKTILDQHPTIAQMLEAIKINKAL